MKTPFPLANVLSLHLALVSFTLAGPPADPSAGSLPRSSPEAQGISSSGILDFIETADRRIHALHSFILIRHGRVAAEGWWAPYSAPSPHELYSLSKSFTSTAVGLAAAEGKLSIDDPVLAFFPDDAPAEPSGNLKAMRVRDLLSMSTGHEKEPTARPDQVSAKSFLSQPVPFKPGTHFLYNTAATFLLSAIVQKTTGQTVLDYLQPRLFEPLGIERPVWESSFQGISLGGYGLSLRTEDIARFGQLFLQKGVWSGRRLLPAEWVEAASARQTSTGSNPASDWDQGYGFQFWRCRHGGAYRGDGAFGQYCIVLPAEDAVIAITSGLKNMQEVLDLAWEKLLPAMKPGPLPEDPDARKKLEDRLASLELRRPEGLAASPTQARISGKVYRFPANDQKLDSVSLETGASLPAGDAGGVRLILRSGGAEQRVACGSGRWEKGRLAHALAPERPMAACGAWVSEDSYQARIYFYETPFCLTIQLRFAGDQLSYESEMDLGFGQIPHLKVEGRCD